MTALQDAARDVPVRVAEGKRQRRGRFVHGLPAASRAIRVLTVQGLRFFVFASENIVMPFERLAHDIWVKFDEASWDSVVLHGHRVVSLEA